LTTEREFPNERSRKRYERYKELTRLGYSATEARRLRDHSGENIDKQIVTTTRQLARIPAEDRSPQVQRRLRILRDQQTVRRTEPEKILGRYRSRNRRIRDFSEWSKNRNFPPEVLKRIRDINRRARKRNPRFNDYGFRIWYHMYVNRESEAVSKRRFNSVKYERRDT
jgi:hypothetical protein